MPGNSFRICTWYTFHHTSAVYLSDASDSRTHTKIRAFHVVFNGTAVRFFYFQIHTVRCGAVFNFFKIIRCSAVRIIVSNNLAVRCAVRLSVERLFRTWGAVERAPS